MTRAGIAHTCQRSNCIFCGFKHPALHMAAVMRASAAPAPAPAPAADSDCDSGTLAYVWRKWQKLHIACIGKAVGGKRKVGQEEGVSWLGTAAHQSGKAGIDNTCQA